MTSHTEYNMMSYIWHHTQNIIWCHDYEIIYDLLPFSPALSTALSSKLYISFLLNSSLTYFPGLQQYVSDIKAGKGELKLSYTGTAIWPIFSLYLSLTHSLSLSLSHSHTHSHSLTLSLSLTLSPTHSHSLSLTISFPSLLDCFRN